MDGAFLADRLSQLQVAANQDDNLQKSSYSVFPSASVYFQYITRFRLRCVECAAMQFQHIGGRSTFGSLPWL